MHKILTCMLVKGHVGLLPVLEPRGGGGVQPVLTRSTPQLSFKTWAGDVHAGIGGGGVFVPGVGGGVFLPRVGGGSGRGSGGVFSKG